MCPAASPSGRRGRRPRRLSCLPTCFSSPSVFDLDDEQPTPTDERSPDAFWFRIRSQSRTVPVEEIAVEETSSEDPSIAVAGTEIRQKEFLRRLREEQNRSKLISKPLPHKRYNRQQFINYHMSPKYNSYHIHSMSPRHHVCNQAQVGIHISHPSSPMPNIPVASPRLIQRRLHKISTLLMLIVALVVTMFFGRLCAIFCTCAWLYLLPPNHLAPSSPEITFIETIDVDSPQCKKMVVLKGFLERDRSRVPGATSTSITSPTSPR